jgi:hypothetical protein
MSLKYLKCFNVSKISELNVKVVTVLLPTMPFSRAGRHRVTNAWGDGGYDGSLQGLAPTREVYQRSHWITHTSKQLTCLFANSYTIIQ